MAFWNKLFGKRKSNPDFPPEVVKIFEKLRSFLTEDQAQNKVLPKEVRKIIEAGPAVDELPEATGEFGRSVTNPIPVNGPTGEITYLSKLVTPSGVGLFAHRLGSIDRIDVYETVSTDEKVWDILFFSYYHPRKSRKVPIGYQFADVHKRPPLITSTNFRVEDFPFSMRAAIRECSRRVLGFPLAPPGMPEQLKGGFIRSLDQNARLTELLSLGLFPASGFKDAEEPGS